MGAKEKVIGIVLVVLGVLPFLAGVPAVGGILTAYKFLTPGETVYQILIVLLGVLLIWERRRQRVPMMR